MPEPSSASAPESLQRHRLAVAAAFFAQGLIFISLTTRLPTIQRLWDLSELGLSGILLMMVLLSGVGSVVAEKLSTSVESSRLLRAGLLLIAIAVPGIALAPSFGVFVAALAAYGVGVGAVDASGNMQAVALEHRYDRPILPSFHGAWTLGGAIGAATTLLTAHTPLGYAALLAVLPAGVALAPFLPRVGMPTLADLPKISWRPVLLVGLGMVLFYMVDTAAFTWGPTYLDNVFPTPSELVAWATLPYLLASGIMRLAGDRLVARHGVVPVLRVGTIVAFLALISIVTAQTWQVAVAGFTVLGAGVAVIAPLSFSAAARIAGAGHDDPATRHARVDAVIARFNQFNYIGALLGAVMTGVVGSGNLRLGFAVPMVLILSMWPLAKAFASKADPTAG